MNTKSGPRPTRSLAILAAALAVVSAGLMRFPRTARVAGAMTGLAALAAAFAVAQTGHYGGQLVYEHGVGINVAGGAVDAPRAAPKRGHDDDD